MANYWDLETPETVTTSKNVLQYYGDAEKLSVARPMWKDADGKERNGKTVALDIAAMLESDKGDLEQARAVFADIVAKIDNRLRVWG